MKRYRLLFALAALMLVLAACGGKSAPAPAATQAVALPTNTPEAASQEAATEENSTEEAAPEAPAAEESAAITETAAMTETEAMTETAAAVGGQSPWQPWLSAHVGNETPPATLTGPITLRGVQPEDGAVNFLFPGPRALDPNIFGTADDPKRTELPAMIFGIPEKMRATAEDGSLVTAGPTPFGDKVATVPGGVTMTLVDATAMDAATTEDQIDFVATFGSPNGEDTYRVEITKVGAHGQEHPTGGGVITNFIQHGVTGIGTPLMPTLYSYVSFWGLGNIYKNDELIAEGRPMHGMYTEFVRTEPYNLGFDADVSAAASQFHLMIPPFDAEENPSPVPTGFMLPNGQEQPFFHVMFPTVEWTAEVDGVETAQQDLPFTAPEMPPAMMELAKADDAPYKQSPWWPWLSAHVQDENPPQLLTGPIQVKLSQAEGGAANFLLPGPRKLDPTIFGTADDPKGTDLPPIVLGVPEEMRAVADDGTLMTAGPTPFSDKVMTVQGSLDATLVDATATDGAKTQDSIDFTAKFMSPNGEDEYMVVVKAAAPHGWFNPTGGGVVTDFMQHGVTKWGTELMPSLYSYVSFWGMGKIFKNGEQIDGPRPVHGMLTEFVRKAPYNLAFDGEVTPNATHFHLMIPAVDPFGNPNPVKTGFMLPNGKEQPFFHVMFPVVQAEAGPLGVEAAAPAETTGEASAEAGSAMIEVLEGTSDDATEINVLAENLQFNPNEITIKKGEKVRIVAQSGDIFHTFTLKMQKDDPNFLFSLNLFPDQEAQVQEFTATETGDLYFYCIPHEGVGMTGVIHVVE